MRVKFIEFHFLCVLKISFETHEKEDLLEKKKNCMKQIARRKKSVRKKRDLCKKNCGGTKDAVSGG